MHKRNVNTKGITLISLIITIIVMLILATVSVVFLVGDDGLIATASQAKENYERQQILEEDQMELIAIISKYIGNSGISLNDFQNVLPEGWRYEMTNVQNEYKVYNEKDMLLGTVNLGKGSFIPSEKNDSDSDTIAKIEINDLIGTYYGVFYGSTQTIFKIHEDNTFTSGYKDLTTGEEVLDPTKTPYTYTINDSTIELSFVLSIYNSEQGEFVDTNFIASFNAITDTNGDIVNLYSYTSPETLDYVQLYYKNENGFTYDLPQTTYWGKNSEGDTKAKFVFNSENKTVDYYLVDSEEQISTDYTTGSYFIINNEIIVINFDSEQMILNLKVEIIEDWFLQPASTGWSAN